LLAFASAFGLNAWEDRARLQEEDWERHLGDKGVHLAVKMKELMNSTGYEMPLFFANTHDAGNGKKWVVASLPLDSLDFPGAEFPEQEFKTGDDIRLSTAAF